MRIKNRPKRTAKALGLAGVVGLGILFPRISNAGLIHGKVYDAWNGQTSDSTQVEGIINEGSSGTQYSKVPEFSELGEWYVISGNFSPSAQPGDTAKMSGSLTVGPKTYTTYMKNRMQSTNCILPTAFLDDPDKNVIAHSFGVWNVIDTSNVSDTLRAEGWLNKNPDQKIPFWNYYTENSKIDTSDFYPQIYLNLEEQDSIWNQGDNATIRLWKTKGDTIWESDTTFPLDTLKYGGATMLENMVFPERRFVTDTTPPTISNVTEWQDTTHQGPFEVSYDRIDRSGILSDSLIYKVNQETSKTVPADSVVGDKAYCTIDTIVATDDSIHYKVKSIDASANTNVAYWPASGWHSFKVNSIGNEESQPAEKSFRVSPNPFYSNVNISAPVEKAELNIYDVSGRLVDEVQVNNYKAEWGKDVSKGIYFVKPKLGTLNGKIEVKNGVWKLIKL
ncbi:T9SS type A sorting domain-containing protein [candidate division WOR-3 bacterium]|nr:T9SS type A sorting domain-containing protein [candidate division WOR-3 bacterium]